MKSRVKATLAPANSASPNFMLIASIVRANGLTLATRNRRHFDGLGIPLFNPWSNAAA